MDKREYHTVFKHLELGKAGPLVGVVGGGVGRRAGSGWVGGSLVFSAYMRIMMHARSKTYSYFSGSLESKDLFGFICFSEGNSLHTND